MTGPAREQVAYLIAQFEGGDSNHPLDRGGLTRYGLTFKEFERLRQGKTVADFAALTRDDIVDIITEEWALRPGYWRIADAWVRLAVIDFAINSGVRTATKALQRAAGITGDAVDGLFGRSTESIVNGQNPERLFRRVMAERVEHFARIVARDASQRVFIKGWMARASALLRAA
jgi:lysozyme family protein